MAEVAPLIEDRGIDEIYIDLSRRAGRARRPGHDPLGGVRAVAQEIRNSVSSATGLSCSIGVTPNKLLSKIASELDKPDGLTILASTTCPARIWPLPVRRINGIGPKAGAKLAALGIAHHRRAGRRDPRSWLVEHFGRSYGAWLHDAAHGRDDRPVVTHSEPVSMSRETTFERDLHAGATGPNSAPSSPGCASRWPHDLQRKGYAGRTVGIKLRFEDFRTVTRDLTLAGAHGRCRCHPRGRRRMPEAGGPEAPAAPAGRARRLAEQAGSRTGDARPQARRRQSVVARRGRAGALLKDFSSP